MITIKGNGGIYEGDSTDTKPSDVAVNTIFHELDTNCKYYFTGEDWAEIPSSGGGGGGGTDNYNELSNKPSINSVTLSGNKTAANLGLQAEITGDVTISSDNVDDTGATNLFVTSEEKSAWNGKQDALTIDSEPTESSTNPVQSGGVYTALSGKQAALAFDGTYSATTNKVATESTVTGAISALDKSSVGLDNVTNNAQVKAVSSAVTSGDIVTFGADGATVQDSGKAIETSLTDSNDKVPTSKAVRDNVAANATMSSGYAADSSEANITSSTSINDAIEQLDYRTTTNKNNISFVASQGRKNVLKFDSVGGGAYSGITYTVNDDGTVRVSGTANALSYEYLRINNSNFNAKEYANGQFVLSGCPSGGGSGTYSLYAAKGNYAKFDYGDGVILTPTSESEVYIVLRVEKNQTVDIVFKPMIRLIGTDSTFEPYALSNAELTAKEQVNENNILNLKTMGQYTMNGTYSSETRRTTFAALFKNALDSLGLDTSQTHHYMAYIYTDTVSPTAEILIQYGTYKHGDSITHSAVYSSQITFYADNNQGTLVVSGATAPVKATLRYLD